jgi:hypothetical protein
MHESDARSCNSLGGPLQEVADFLQMMNIKMALLITYTMTWVLSSERWKSCQIEDPSYQDGNEQKCGRKYEMPNGMV